MHDTTAAVSKCCSDFCAPYMTRSAVDMPQEGVCNLNGFLQMRKDGRLSRIGISYETVLFEQRPRKGGRIEHGAWPHLRVADDQPRGSPAAYRSLPMTKHNYVRLLNVALFSWLVALPVTSHAAAVRPCEDVLKEMRTAKASANLTPDAKSKVDTLEAKAVERCNADDDKRSDAFLQEAMALMGK